jgi:beta-glucanase (GH16 family)
VWVAYTYIVFVPCYSAEWINNTLLNSALALFVRRNCRSATDFPRNPLDKAGWILTFEDDFNTGQIDYNAWKDHAWWGDRWAGDGVDIPNGQYPSIYFSPNCFSFGPSTVKLEATNIPANVTDPKSNIQFPVPYSVGRLEWIDKHDQQHGYFEIRCKIPGTIEQWPAFWLASRKSWPPEIDVFEFYTNNLKRFETTTWWGTNENRFKETWSHPVCKPDELFHVYACEWDENSIKFYYDNMLIRQSAQGIEEFVFPMHVIVCAGIDNRSGHHPENATYPNYFEVDYVRAYRKI